MAKSHDDRMRDLEDCVEEMELDFEQMKARLTAIESVQRNIVSLLGQLNKQP